MALLSVRATADRLVQLRAQVIVRRADVNSIESSNRMCSHKRFGGR